MHNSPEGTNLSVGDPEKYDQLIVLIGPKSNLRIGSIEESFHSYRFNAVEVKKLMARISGYYCAKSILKNRSYDSIEYKA